MNFKLSQTVKWGAFIVPLVPAASMADQVFKEVSVGTSFETFLVLTASLALVGGVGFELVGIGSGHLTVKYFVEKRWPFFVLSLIALLVYVGVGFYKFGATTSGLFLIIAPFIYLLSGMIEISEKEDEIRVEKEKHEAKMKALDRQQALEDKKAEAEFKRVERSKNAEYKRQSRAVKQVTGGVASALQQLAELVANDGLRNRVLSEVEGTKKVIIETLVATPSATTTQLKDATGVTRRAVAKSVNSLVQQFFEEAQKQ